MGHLLEKLFSESIINNLVIPNRIIMAPMTRSLSPNSIPGKDVARYYKKRVEGGVGLIITEGTTVDSPNASNDKNVPCFYGDAVTKGWKNVVAEVHDSGGLIFPQLWHQGTMRRADETWNPDVPSYGPSGLSSPGKVIGDPMTRVEIEETMNAFVKGIVLSREAGFDGVELHGAHGYLLDQFFWLGTNIRKDEWGGISLEERTRFATEIIKRARKEVGKDYPIIIRFSQWKQQDFDHKMADNPDSLRLFLDTFVDAGIDAFHCSQRRFWEHEFEFSELNLAGWVRKLSNKPSITVGSVGLDLEFVETFQENKGSDSNTDLTNLLERLDKNEFDFVAVGRALISNPDWCNLIKNKKYDKIKGYFPKDLEELN